MDFQEVVGRRRMVRNFDSRPPPAESLARILDNARRAPSAGFSQGTELLVLEGPEETGRYWQVCLPPERRHGFRWPGVLRAPVLIVPMACRDAYLERYAEPDKGWIDRDPARWPVPYWDVDAAFSTMLVLLTAVDAGLGALFLRAHRPDALRAEFGVPDRYLPIGTVALGYPLPDEPSPSLARGRRSESEVVHRGRW